MSNEPFNFQSHSERAASAFLAKRDFYESLSSVVSRILTECINVSGIVVHSVQHRAKDPKSFSRKASTPADHDPNIPKYQHPLEEITDLAGIRVITYFPSTLADVDRIISAEFLVVERSDKSLQLIEEEKFGYQSVHYLVRLGDRRENLPEYKRFRDGIVEIQVRTILQHAWAEIEHDIQYKSPTSIPPEIRRRFMSLAGILEMADREFQAIQNADRTLNAQSVEAVRTGNLDFVDVTPAALKELLDQKLGSDGRVSEWSYEWAARLVKALGFKDLKKLGEAIAPYGDGHELSVLAWGGRQGQLTRFELMLLAACPRRFMTLHPWGAEPGFKERSTINLDKFQKKKIPVGDFDRAIDVPL